MKKLPKSVTPEEFPLLIKKTESKEYKVAFLLAYGSGLRLSEVLAVKPLHVVKNRIEVIDGKGGKDRMVPIPKKWKQWMTQILPIKKTGRSLERNFKKSAKLAKLNPLYSFHSLRHGFAVRCLEKGMPINFLQTLMGHSNLATTSIYTLARPKKALESYEEYF